MKISIPQESDITTTETTETLPDAPIPISPFPDDGFPEADENEEEVEEVEVEVEEEEVEEAKEVLNEIESEKVFKLIAVNFHWSLKCLIEENQVSINSLKRIAPEKYSEKGYAVGSAKNILEHTFIYQYLQSAQVLMTAGWELSREEKIQLLNLMLENHARQSFAYVLKQVELSKAEIKDLIKKSCESGDVSIVMMLTARPELKYFEKIIARLRQGEFEKSSVFSLISKALRFSEKIEHVRSICTRLQVFLTGKNLSSVAVAECLAEIEQAFVEGPQWLSSLSRFMDVRSINEVNKVYNAQSSLWEHEYRFGKKNYQVATDHIKMNAEILSPPFSDLPSPPVKITPPLRPLFSIARFIQYVTNSQMPDLKERNNLYIEKFCSIRKSSIGLKTPILNNRYQHALPFFLYTAKFCLKSLIKIQGELWIPYKNKPITKLQFDSKYHLPELWWHGCGDFLEYLPDIDVLANHILSLTHDEVISSPKKFYDPVAEVCWALGHLSPKERGTGLIVETWLIFINDIFGLPPLVLFPNNQRDCLNLSLTLETYQEIFLDLVEPESLPEFAREYLERLNKSNPDRLTPELIKKKVYENDGISDIYWEEREEELPTIVHDDKLSYPATTSGGNIFSEKNRKTDTARKTVTQDGLNFGPATPGTSNGGSQG